MTRMDFVAKASGRVDVVKYDNPEVRAPLASRRIMLVARSNPFKSVTSDLRPKFPPGFRRGFGFRALIPNVGSPGTGVSRGSQNVKQH